MYGRILIPFDASFHSEKALSHAHELAKVHKSEIILLHVISEIPMFPIIGDTSKSSETGSRPPITEHQRLIYGESQKYIERMLKLKAIAYEQLGLKVSTEVLIGDPVKRVVEYSEKNAIDLIVVGSIGQGVILNSKH